MKKTGKLKVACVISGGKDGIFAYYKLSKNKTKYAVEAFLNLYAEKDKVSFHQYGKKLIKLQARAMGMKIIQKKVADQHKNQQLFEAQVLEIMRKLKKSGFGGVCFGYILKGDYQDRLMHRICKQVGLKLILPNYGKRSEDVLKGIIQSGMKCLITSIRPEKISDRWLGREINHDFLDFLKKKKGVDFCGDHGEYHTFVVNAPFFSQKIKFRRERNIFRTRIVQASGSLIEKHLNLK